MKAMALSGVFVLASAGLAVAGADAPVKPEASLPVAGVAEAAIVVKKTDAPEAGSVSMSCDGAEDAALCAETAAKN
jgi:predicted secreted protein